MEQNLKIKLEGAGRSDGSCLAKSLAFNLTTNTTG